MILDTDKLQNDGAYQADMRHRFLTDGFFAAELLGFSDFNRRAHGPVFDRLYFPKNPNVPIRDQHKKHKRLHLDPRHTFKTTAKRVDRAQWIAAFPEEITVLVESATQPLAQASAQKTALLFYKPRGGSPRPLHLMFPELVTEKFPEVPWNTPNRRGFGPGDLDYTVAFTSPLSTQSGWHPLLIEPDDVEDTKNSGIRASAEVRQGVIDTCDQNENLLRDGGFINICGTRYHPFDWYSKCIDRAQQNPESWEIFIRPSLILKNGGQLIEGDFPPEEEMDLQFPEFMNLSYEELREKFYANYESFMCFRAGSRVLMADWTEKPIEQIKVDDEVIGFERVKAHDIRFQKAKVQRIFSRRAEVAKVTTDTGRVTYPTFDHRFLRPPNGVELSYVRLKIGSKMVSIYTPAPAPSQIQQRDLDWLGGIFDGEGSISPNGIKIYQKETINPEVYAAIGEVLKRLEIDFAIAKTHTTGCFSLSGGRSLLIRLRQQARMVKMERILLTLNEAKQIAESSGRRGGETYPIVVKMDSIGERVVYDIQTSTSNFVCDGFAVHNCQQMNSPMGGGIQRFEERFFDAAQIAPGRIPRNGETFICWRPRYGGNKKMARYSEGAAARIVDDRVFILDAWQGTYTPSGEAEKIVAQCRALDVDGLMIIAVPGSEYLMAHVRNEALRRNRSVKMQWLDFEDDENRRNGKMEQLEPMIKAGRVLFSTTMNRAKECRKQFVYYGLADENGIIDCISHFADLVPLSLMRAGIADREIETMRKRRDDALLSQFLEQQGYDPVDDQRRRQTEASLEAMARTVTFGLPPLPGGLDG